MNTNTLIEQLRIAARQGQPYIDPIMKRLVESLKVDDALVIALNQAISYLPAFEKIHPDIIWPRQWIEAAGKFKPIQHREYGFGFYEDEASDTPSKSFVYALGILDRAFTLYYEKREDDSKKLAASAIACIISSKIIQFWIENFPESWEVYQQTEQEGVVDEKSFEPVREYRASPKRQAYQRDLWLALADEIEAKL